MRSPPALLSFVVGASLVWSTRAAAEESKPRWLFVTVQQDLSWVEGERPCSPESQQSGRFSCFRGDGPQYLGSPRPEDGSTVGPGLSVATTRTLVGYTHFVTPYLGLGGRAGLVLRGGGPRAVGRDARAFLPVHVEAQTTWWPWKPPSEGRGVAGFLLVGAGIAQVDSHFELDVREAPSAAPSPSQLDNPPEQRLDVYKKSGTGFGALGVGAVGALGSKLLWRAAVEGMASFPAAGFALGLEVGLGFDLSR